VGLGVGVLESLVDASSPKRAGGSCCTSWAKERCSHPATNDTHTRKDIERRLINGIPQLTSFAQTRLPASGWATRRAIGILSLYFYFSPFISPVQVVKVRHDGPNQKSQSDACRAAEPIPNNECNQCQHIKTKHQRAELN